MNKTRLIRQGNRKLVNLVLADSQSRHAEYINVKTKIG